jgi:aryl-alcohol dehydrogenase-like predicted oxidoreductase
VGQVVLGRSGLRVSSIALGSAQFWGCQDLDGAIATIRSARELGINFFDGARIYDDGHCEEVLAAGLREDLRRRRHEVVLASKGGLRMTPEGLQRDASPAKLRRDVEDSLAAFGVEQIDVYELHWPDPKVPLSESAGALADLQAEGKIGHVGLSNVDVDEMATFGQACPVEALQPAYHLFCREIELEVLPYAAEHDIGVFVYGALGHGLLSGTLSRDMVFPATDWRSANSVYQGDAYPANLGVVDELGSFSRDQIGCPLGQLAVAWVLAHPAVDVAIVGTNSVGHMAEALAAAEMSLDRSVMDRIDEIMKPAVPGPGPTPETTPVFS